MTKEIIHKNLKSDPRSANAMAGRLRPYCRLHGFRDATGLGENFYVRIEAVLEHIQKFSNREDSKYGWDQTLVDTMEKNNEFISLEDILKESQKEIPGYCKPIIENNIRIPDDPTPVEDYNPAVESVCETLSCDYEGPNPDTIISISFLPENVNIQGELNLNSHEGITAIWDKQNKTRHCYMTDDFITEIGGKDGNWVGVDSTQDLSTRISLYNKNLRDGSSNLEEFRNHLSRLDEIRTVEGKTLDEHLNEFSGKGPFEFSGKGRLENRGIIYIVLEENKEDESEQITSHSKILQENISCLPKE